MDDIELSKALWNDHFFKDDSNREYCNSNVLEQYKTYIEMADRVSSRRDTANNFFLLINSALIAAGPPFIEKYVQLTSKWMLVFPFIVISLLLFFWWRLIFSYKQLNGAKFRIIGLIEERLPARIYGEAEWKSLLGEGKERKKYWPLTHLESKVPWIFFFVYLALFLAHICS